MRDGIIRNQEGGVRMTLNDEQLAKDRSFVVAKDNRLITKSRYSLTVQQQKILLYLISRIKPNDEVGTTYELPISDFIKVCGYDNAYYYKAVKDDIKKLHDTSSWIEVEKGKEVLFSWIDKAEINHNSGKIRITFHSTVSPYLFELREKYTQYNLYNVLCLSHKYSIRLYEYLMSLRYKKIFEVSVEELKKRVDAEKYKSFGNFHSRVLKPAVYDINDYTDINVEYKLKKSGKTIISIIFKIRENDDRDYTMAKIFRDRKLDPERRSEARARKKIVEERRKHQNDEAIKAEGMVMAQLTLEELITQLENKNAE